MADRTTNHPEPDADIEQQLRVGLAELIRTAPDPTHRDLDLDDAPDPHPDHGRRRFLVGAGVATVAIGAGLGVGVLMRRDRSNPVEVMLSAAQEEPTSTPRTATSSAAWVTIGAAPISPRLLPAIVWTGDRLIVWGGAVIDGPNRFCPPDGASWTPDSGTWSAIASNVGIVTGAITPPEADASWPASMGAEGFAVWDGTEMVVGVTEADSRAPWNQGAGPAEVRCGINAYDPATDTWRYVSPVESAEVNRAGFSRQAVRVPAGLIVGLRDANPLPSATDLVLVDLASGTQRPLPLGPFDGWGYPDGSGTVDLVAVGDAVVATTNWDLHPWVFDPARETWRQAPPPPGATSLHLLPAAAVGDRAVFAESDENRSWLFDPRLDGDDAWRAIAPDPSPVGPATFEPVWSGAELLVPGAAYDPDADTWRAIASPPIEPGIERTGMHAVWIDTGLVLLGGASAPDVVGGDRAGLPEHQTFDGWYLPDP